MRRWDPRYALLILWIVLFVALCTGPRPASASHTSQEDSGIARGGALYDNWYAELGVEPPEGDMPLWERQSTNTRSGPVTWRCVACHGWDYQGKDGAYRSGSNYTGFPGIYLSVQQMSVEQIEAHLKGRADPLHDYSDYLDDQSITDLANFLKNGVIDDTEFIDLNTMHVRNGDVEHGQELYTQSCASCHGEDGAGIALQEDLLNASLNTIAVNDPWRFLHKTRFGTPGTPMPIGYELGWTPQDGRDVLAYVQSFPTAPQAAPSVGEIEQTQEPSPGGPARNILTGIITALTVMGASVGFALLLGGFMVGVILFLVWLIRGRR